MVERRRYRCLPLGPFHTPRALIPLPPVRYHFHAGCLLRLPPTALPRPRAGLTHCPDPLVEEENYWNGTFCFPSVVLVGLGIAFSMKWQRRHKRKSAKGCYTW